MGVCCWQTRLKRHFEVMPHLLIAPSKWDTRGGRTQPMTTISSVSSGLPTILTSHQVLAVVDLAWNGPIGAVSRRRDTGHHGVMGSNPVRNILGAPLGEVHLLKPPRHRIGHIPGITPDLAGFLRRT